MRRKPILKPSSPIPINSESSRGSSNGSDMTDVSFFDAAFQDVETVLNGINLIHTDTDTEDSHFFSDDNASPEINLGDEEVFFFDNSNREDANDNEAGPSSFEEWHAQQSKRRSNDFVVGNPFGSSSVVNENRQQRIRTSSISSSSKYSSPVSMDSSPAKMDVSQPNFFKSASIEAKKLSSETVLNHLKEQIEKNDVQIEIENIILSTLRYSHVVIDKLGYLTMQEQVRSIVTNKNTLYLSFQYNDQKVQRWSLYYLQNNEVKSVWLNSKTLHDELKLNADELSNEALQIWQQEIINIIVEKCKFLPLYKTHIANRYLLGLWNERRLENDWDNLNKALKSDDPVRNVDEWVKQFNLEKLAEKQLYKLIKRLPQSHYKRYKTLTIQPIETADFRKALVPLLSIAGLSKAKCLQAVDDLREFGNQSDKNFQKWLQSYHLENVWLTEFKNNVIDYELLKKVNPKLTFRDEKFSKFKDADPIAQVWQRVQRKQDKIAPEQFFHNFYKIQWLGTCEVGPQKQESQKKSFWKGLFILTPDPDIECAQFDGFKKWLEQYGLLADLEETKDLIYSLADNYFDKHFVERHKDELRYLLESQYKMDHS